MPGVQFCVYIPDRKMKAWAVVKKDPKKYKQVLKDLKESINKAIGEE